MRVGIIGGGQLAAMMAEAAKTLGITVIVQTPQTSDPAVRLAAETVLAEVDDAVATAHLATCCDVITFENEFVNLEALRSLEAQGVCFRPGLQALAPLLDKYEQRCFLRDLGLPVPNFGAIVDHSIPPPSIPVVLKTRRHGYDGQGTVVVQTVEEWEYARRDLRDRPLLWEEFVPFERELAAIAARSVSGEIAVYPIVETQQEQQVCRRVFAPVPLPPEVITQAAAIARTILEALNVVGVFGIELFLTREGKVLVNEIAPRVHNSGHFTMDACETSQFEQHLRAVCGLPLGSVALRSSAAVMVNLLGYEHSTSDYATKRQQLAAVPNAHLHWYGKVESRPGRKLGHVTVLCEASEKPGNLPAIAQTVESIWYPP